MGLLRRLVEDQDTAGAREPGGSVLGRFPSNRLPCKLLTQEVLPEPARKGAGAGEEGGGQVTPLLAESCRGWLWSDSVGVSEVQGCRNPRQRSWASIVPGAHSSGPCGEVWAASWRRRPVLARGGGGGGTGALWKDTLAFLTWKRAEAQASFRTGPGGA